MRIHNAIALFLFFCFAAVQVPAQQDGAFNWSMALLNARTGESIPFSAPVTSQTGERFRLVIEAGAASFCYVIAESSDEDNVGVLYAGSLKSGEVWQSSILELSPPGGEVSLFIVVSGEEQRDLSQRITALHNNNGPAQKRALMNEVFRIRSNASRFREAPEKPVLMGGAARSAENSGPDNNGIEFSGLATYVKAISIEH